MLSIPCPYCGPRDHTEFTYGGDAGVIRPDLAAPFAGAWYEAIYIRDNPCGPHREYWLHAAGCRAWLVVRRDTLTHEIAGAEPAAGVAAAARSAEAAA